MGFSFKNLDPRRAFGGKGNPFSAIQNELNSLKNQIGQVDQIRRELNQLKRIPNELGDLKGKLEHLPNEIGDLKNKIEHLPEEAKEEIEKLIKAGVGAAVKSALEFGYHELKDNIDILESFAIEPDFSLFTSLIGGGFSFSWGEFSKRLEKAEMLVRAIGDAKNQTFQTRTQIINLAKIVGPDKIGVKVSAVSLGINVVKGLDRLDHYLNKAGVPK